MVILDMALEKVAGKYQEMKRQAAKPVRRKADRKGKTNPFFVFLGVPATWRLCVKILFPDFPPGRTESNFMVARSHPA
jgi:hypothetical protein